MLQGNAIKVADKNKVVNHMINLCSIMVFLVEY